MKRIICVLIIFIFAFSQIGCNKKTTTSPESKASESNEAVKATSSVTSIDGSSNAQETTSKPQDIKLVKKQNKTKYLLSNGIDIKRPQKTIEISGKKVNYTLAQVDGLKDKTLEANLNKTIESDVYAAMKESLSKVEVDKISPEYHCSEVLNENNLLCIKLSSYYSAPLYGFLYRLTDGKRLGLKDIFTDGTDYVSLVNQKIRESIIAGRIVTGIYGDDRTEDELILSEPFSTIKPEQNFAISHSSLYIIFHKGESGFEKDNAVEIPLTSIDDYVDVTDRYSGTERKNHEKTSLIVRNNNIFTTEKSSITKRKNGEFWMEYPVVSGLRDDAFEQVINTTIQNAMKEVSDNSVIDTLEKNKSSSTFDSMKNCVAMASAYVTFNDYGLICIERNLEDSNFKHLKDFHTIYSFDLIKKQPFSVKAFLNDYFNKNEDLKQPFMDELKKSLKLRSKNVDAQSLDKMDFSFVMDKSIITFISGYSDPNANIIVYFPEGTIKGISEEAECQVPLKIILKGAPEDFFGW